MHDLTVLMLGLSDNLGDRLGKHLLQSRARAATLLKSMRRYLGIHIRQSSSGSDSHSVGFHLYSKRPRLGLGISLLCGYGDLDWD